MYHVYVPSTVKQINERDINPLTAGAAYIRVFIFDINW